jgi:hypothetical protein
MFGSDYVVMVVVMKLAVRLIQPALWIALNVRKAIVLQDQEVQ